MSVPIMRRDISKKKFQHFQKELDYQRHCRLLLQQKNCKQSSFILRRQQVVYKRHQTLA